MKILHSKDPVFTTYQALTLISSQFLMKVRMFLLNKMKRKLQLRFLKDPISYLNHKKKLISFQTNQMIHSSKYKIYL